MAVGGYGRGTLAPFSDIDLLFVRPYKQTAHAESVIEFMLYALWDLGFKVGHASRTVDECIKLSREDFTIRTSILEARRLTGDEKLADELMRRFRDEVVKGTGAEFVAAKLKERDERHARAGASRYHGRAQRQGGQGRPARPQHPVLDRPVPASRPTASRTVLQLEMFDGREVRAFIRAFDFLWAVRTHLHFATGRPEERLTFDLQPEIARRMGYRRPAATTPGGRAVHAPLLPDRQGGRRADPRLRRQAGGRAGEEGAQGPVAPPAGRAGRSASRWTSRASTRSAAA